MGCPQLEELTIPDNIRFICDKAFSLSGMTSIRLPEGVGIEPSILDGCKGLKSITIGERTSINLNELGENLIFECLQRTINEETGQEQWYISYSDEKGNMHTHELSGVMSIEAKKIQINREHDEETIRYFHDQRTDKHFKDMETGRYCITEPQIGKATIYEPVIAKANAQKQVVRDEQELEQGNIKE